MSAHPSPPRRIVCFVTANTFEFDSRTLRTAEALVAEGVRVVVVAMAARHLPAEETLAGGILVRRPRVDRRISSAFRPLPGPVRAALSGLIGLNAGATALPRPRGGGADRVLGVVRRAVEILAYRRRIAPWSVAAAAAAPDAAVFSAKALVALPVAARAAKRTGGRYVYDVADLHVESGRLAGLPRFVKAYLRSREAGLIRGAAALTAATPALAAEVARQYGVTAPLAVLNARPRWRADEIDVPRSTLLADALGIPAARPIVLYQGAFREDQGVEELIAALREPPLREREIAVAFLGFGKLEAALQKAAVRDARIAVLPAVPSAELLDWTAGATVSFVGAPPRTINQRLTTPNKLFESLMAGVPVIVAAATATADLVTDAGVGRAVDPWTPRAIAAAIAELVDLPPADAATLRRHIREVALDRYNWESQRDAVAALYTSVIESARP
jgi:glycosyltransferase involved in cell wall biosynthesis